MPKQEMLERLGLYSINDAAELLACEPIQLARLIAIGSLAYHQDGKGRLLCEADQIKAFMSDGCPSLNAMPPLDAERVWFRARPPIEGHADFTDRLRKCLGEKPSFQGSSLERSAYAAMGKPTLELSPSAAASKFKNAYASHGAAYLRTEVLTKARYHADNIGDVQGTPAERLFGQGPDRFRAMTNNIAEKVSLSKFDLGSGKVKLSDIAGSSLREDIKFAIDSAFATDATRTPRMNRTGTRTFRV